MREADADVVVVGSGAGGAAAAWKLTEMGMSVLLLEAGPAYVPEDYRLHLGDWETSLFPDKLGAHGRQTAAPMQQLDPTRNEIRSWNHIRGHLVPGGRRRFVGYSHVAGLGGSTLHYAGEAHRMNPRAMRLRTEFGVGADWPLEYAELDRHYLEAERMVGVAGPAEDPVRPRTAAYPLPAHRLSYASQKLKAAAARLRLSWTPNPVAALSRSYDGRPGCNYCANCLRGCPRRDKGSADVTFVRHANNSGRCEIRTGVAVTEVLVGKADRVVGIRCHDDRGGVEELGVRALVLACGAVETPRLLLASTSGPDGVANESGQVGRNFMETLSWYSLALHPEALGSHRGLPSDAICWDFNAPDAIPGIIGGCRFSPATAEADVIGPVAYAQRVVRGFGRAHQEAMRANFGHVIGVGAIGENLSYEGSFVSLDSEARDPFGVPKARIHSHLPDRELDRLTFMARTCRALLDAAGAEAPFEEAGTYDLFHATHVFGTCRMGRDPATSVVDPYGRSHRWRNLFVADASVFPSSGGGEAPSLTIHALALRTAEHLRSLVRRREL